MPTAIPGPQASRTASNTASGTRILFSSDPPQASWRWLEIGDKN
jgi:hypothetical protein